MDLVVFSDNNRIRHCFGAIERSRKHSVRYHPVDELRGWLRNGRTNALVYVDIGSISESAGTRLLRQLSRLSDVPHSVIDPANRISDPAALLRAGAVDYVNRSLFAEGVSPRRIDEIAEFVSNTYPDAVIQPGRLEEAADNISDGRALVVSGADWSGVRTGKEYSFYMLFAELDNAVDYANRTSERYTMSVVGSFQRLLERTIAPYQGRLWIWRDFGGVVLFPFDGQTCQAVLPCIRMILNRPLDNIEQFDLKTSLSYRFSLHLGNTVYQNKGDTSHIVSDSINYVHHLGQKFTLPGNFTLTSNVYQRIPEKLQSVFKPIGTYEGREVYRMRLPQRPT